MQEVWIVFSSLETLKTQNIRENNENLHHCSFVVILFIFKVNFQMHTLELPDIPCHNKVAIIIMIIA